MNETTNFSDVIKKSFLQLDSFNQVSFIEMFWSLLIAFGLGMLIYWVYRKCYRGVVYSHNYNVSFVLMTIITALIIMTISSNIVLSLGMVGALSIVRFRTAVKDPMDIMFMFWSISAGIATGATLYAFAIVGSIVITLVIFFMARRQNSDAPYLLVIHFDDEAAEPVKIALRKLKYVLKSKTVRKHVTEMTVEIRLKDPDDTQFINELSNVNGVSDVVLVSYNGDYAQ
ncbi:DUF4956 domain-containing protein [Paenibacillus sp. WLX2291]|uniref:DUF4956 domain-containing protein n=1 Tax=Paenibacillus sp. WLX2291 TaxID=3296934 RepID=UPI003984154F